MNTVNASTGLSGFQLMMGQLPRVIPLLVTIPSPPGSNSEVNNTITNACIVLQRLENNIQVAKDNLLWEKVTQATQKNKGHSAEKTYTVGQSDALYFPLAKGLCAWQNSCPGVMAYTQLLMLPNMLGLCHKHTKLT